MPKGHYPFIICTAPHQRDLLHRPSSTFVAHLNSTSSALTRVVGAAAMDAGAGSSCAAAIVAAAAASCGMTSAAIGDPPAPAGSLIRILLVPVGLTVVGGLVAVDGAAGLARRGDGNAVLHGDLVGVRLDGDLHGLARVRQPDLDPLPADHDGAAVWRQYTPGRVLLGGDPLPPSASTSPTPAAAQDQHPAPWPGSARPHAAAAARRRRRGPPAVRDRARPGLRYARLDAPISSTRNTGWSLGSGSLVKHGSTARPQTFR